jgi:type I restriction-modification system DNA methylase subunit
MSTVADKSLHKVDVWKSRLGLFPMPLFEDEFIQQKLIMLNGGASGDFCLDFSDNKDADEIRSNAWSSDVGHYITVNNDEVGLFRWDTFRSEKYKIGSVENRLEDFYQFLRKQNINRQESIVKFGISLYRNIRNTIRDGKGNDSLSILLYMLAKYCDDNLSTDFNETPWVFPDGASKKAGSIRPGDYQRLIEQFRNGLEARGLKPNINLLLRHAAGSIFQEAQFETLFPLEYQTSIDGFLAPQTPIAPKKREQTSAHYTPTSIVRTIVEETLRDFNVNASEVTAFDPACGSGEFLKEFLRQIRIKGYRGKIKIIGWDISQTGIDMARFILNHEVRSYKTSAEIIIEKRDALESSNTWTVQADYLLMNPPFISWELMSHHQRDGVSSILGKLMDKRPNSAGAFLWNGFQCLKPNGKIGCVVPTSIFEADSFDKLRKELYNNLKIEIIGRLGSHSLYADALVDTGIFIAHKESSKSTLGPVILWSDYKTESNSTALRELRKIRSTDSLPTASESGYSIYLKTDFNINDAWAPIEVHSYELLSKLKQQTKVQDLFDVRQGARTGMNSVFIVDKAYWSSLNKRERKYFRPAVTNESIRQGQLVDKYYIFFPEGNAAIETESQLKNYVRQYFKDFLYPNKKKLSDRPSNAKHYWKLSRHREWQEKHVPKIVSTEFGKAGSFAFDHSGMYVAERSHAWFPKKNREMGELGYAYITVLSLPIINDLLKGISKQIGGGQWYLASKYINNMPIPDLFDKKIDESLIRDLISTGRLIDAGEAIDRDRLKRFSDILFHGK